MEGRIAATEAVRAVINQYIDGSARGDGELLGSLFHPDAVMMGHLGATCLAGSPEPFLRSAAGSPQGDDYQATIMSITVAGAVATVHLCETGYAGGDFDDFFHLLDVDGRWLITSKLFHRA